MDKKVFLSIIGNQRSPDGENERIEFITEGRLYSKDNVYYIEYDESELYGMEGTKTIITIDGDQVSLERQGVHQSQFVFEKGRKFINYYNTPFGNLEMGIYSIKVDSLINENEGKLELTYQLDIGGKYAGCNELSVSYSKHFQRTDGQQFIL